MKVTALLLAALVGLAAAGVSMPHHPLSDAAINHINSHKSTWTVSDPVKHDGG